MRLEERASTICGAEDYAVDVLADPHAGSEKLVEDRDELLALVDRLDDEVAKILVYLKLGGYTFQDLAGMTPWSVRTMKRLWKGIRKKCERWRREHGEE